MNGLLGFVTAASADLHGSFDIDELARISGSGRDRTPCVDARQQVDKPAECVGHGTAVASSWLLAGGEGHGRLGREG